MAYQKRVIVSKKHPAFLVPYHEKLEKVLPQAKRLEDYLVIPHGIDETKFMKNLGFKVPSPMYRYPWVGDPFDNQKTTAEMLIDNKRAFVLNEMGTGKTRSVLYAVDFLKRIGKVNRVLVVAPLSTLTFTWEREIFAYFSHLDVGVLHGPKAKRLKVLGTPHDVYVINHDGIKILENELVARKDIDCVIIDEIAVFRNQRTGRFKSLKKLIDSRDCYAWGLTGAPTPNAPSDAWAQCKLLVPDRVPRWFKQFREETMTQVTEFKWVPRKEANEVVFNAMQPAVRFTRDECLDLPPTSYITHATELSPIQKKVYEKLARTAVVAFQQGKVTAANEGVLMSKLIQVSCGAVYSNLGERIWLDNTPRMNTLFEVIEETEQKVLIFVPFISVVDFVHDALVKKGINVAKVYGATTKRERDIIFNDFQFGEKLRAIVAHPKTMAHGLTLTKANTIIWFAPNQSLEEYEQANARIVRPGQKHNTLIVHLQGSPVEQSVYTRLQRKAKVQGALLELFEKIKNAA